MNSERRQCLVRWAALAAGLPAMSHAQGGKVVKLLVGFAPGGAVDVVGRAIAEAMRETAGMQIIVDNRPGAGGRLALDTLGQVAPDGATLLLMPSTHATMAPHFNKRRSFDPFQVVEPVAALGELQFALVAGPATTAATLKDYIDWARANPEKSTFGSPGVGTAMHLVGLMFAKAAGIELAHVPYKGGAPALTDLLGGQVPLVASTLPQAMPPFKEGKVRILAYTGSVRRADLPGVPTFKEAGYPELTLGESYGIHAPVRTPAALLDELNGQLARAARQAAFVQMRERLGFTPLELMRGQYAARLRDEYNAWAPIVQRTGYTADS